MPRLLLKVLPVAACLHLGACGYGMARPTGLSSCDNPQTGRSPDNAPQEYHGVLIDVPAPFTANVWESTADTTARTWSTPNSPDGTFRLHLASKRRVFDSLPGLLSEPRVCAFGPELAARLWTYQAGRAVVGGVESVPHVVAAEIRSPSGGWVYFTGRALSDSTASLIVRTALSMRRAR